MLQTSCRTGDNVRIANRYTRVKLPLWAGPILRFRRLACPLLILVVDGEHFVQVGHVGKVKHGVAVGATPFEVCEGAQFGGYGVGEEGGEVSVLDGGEAEPTSAIYGESSSANDSVKFTANALPRIS